MQRNPWLTGTAIVFIIFTVSVILFFSISTPCLILKNGDTGNHHIFSIKDGDEFSVTFIHSVNNSPVTDVYQIRKSKIYVDRTIYYAFGAGVQTEIEEGQSLEYGQDGL